MLAQEELGHDKTGRATLRRSQKKKWKRTRPVGGGEAVGARWGLPAKATRPVHWRVEMWDRGTDQHFALLGTGVGGMFSSRAPIPEGSGVKRCEQGASKMVQRAVTCLANPWLRLQSQHHIGVP